MSSKAAKNPVPPSLVEDVDGAEAASHAPNTGCGILGRYPGTFKRSKPDLV